MHISRNGISAMRRQHQADPSLKQAPGGVGGQMDAGKYRGILRKKKLAVVCKRTATFFFHFKTSIQNLKPQLHRNGWKTTMVQCPSRSPDLILSRICGLFLETTDSCLMWIELWGETEACPDVKNWYRPTTKTKGRHCLKKVPLL